MEENRHIKGLEFLQEDYDPTNLKKLELVASMNHYRKAAVCHMGLTKDTLLTKYEEEIVANRQALLVEWNVIEPSGRNIESAGSLTRRGRDTKAKAEAKAPKADAKTEPKESTLKPLDVSLSPAGPRTRSRSRSRSPERSPLRPRSSRKPVEAIAEEDEKMEIEELKAPEPAPTEELLKSPRKRKSRKTKGEEPKAEPKAEPEQPKAELKAEPEQVEERKSPKKSPIKSKDKEEKAKAKEEKAKAKEAKHKTKRASAASESAETSFSNENIFQSGSTAGFKRKRDSDEGDRGARRVSRKDVAPHKHKHAAPAQTLPENAREVFEHAPDLQAPANLSHEPFDVSYGEPAAADFVDQVLQLPDAGELGSELGGELGGQLGAFSGDLARMASTPQRSSFLPTFSEISSKVSEGIHAADEFAGQMNELDTPEVPDSELEREADEHKKELQEDLRKVKEDVESWADRATRAVGGATHAVGGAVSGAGRAVGDAVSGATHAVTGAVSGATSAVTGIVSSAGQAVAGTTSSAASEVSEHYVSWLSALGRFAALVLKIALLSIAVVFTGAIIASGIYLLVWVRLEKIHQGYCGTEPQSVRYPEFLSKATLPEFEPVQNYLYQVFESVTPSCTLCPAEADCALHHAQCRGTRVEQWPLSSWLGLDPLNFECVEDPQKVRWLGELKRRAVIILNNQKAAHECSGAPSAELTREQLRRELYARRAHGIDDKEFAELFERLQADLAKSDPQYPEVSVRQVPLAIEAQLTQLSSEGVEEYTLEDSEYTLAFSSTSLASVSMTCRLRLWGRTWVHKHRLLLRKIVSGAVPVVVMLLGLYRHQARRQHIKAKYTEFIEVIRRVREEADADQTGTLSDYVLEHTLLSQISDKAERDVLIQMIERNPNVRVRQLEKDCEVVRVWEWSA